MKENAFTYKYLEIENFNSVQLELLNCYKNHDTESIQFNFDFEIEKLLKECPTLARWLKTQGLSNSVTYLGHIVIPSGFDHPIHTDCGDDALAINLPMRHCDSARTYFYELREEFLVEKEGFFAFQDPNPTTIGYYVLQRPVILNIKMPHRVVHDENEGPRECVSLRFAEDPWFLTGAA